MKNLSGASSLEILTWLEKELVANSRVEFEVLNPDYEDDVYAGKTFEIEKSLPWF